MRFLAAALMISLTIPLPAEANSYKNFPWINRVILAVGQKMVIDGVRSTTCGAAAPSWATVKPLLSKPTHGKFSDGGTGWRYAVGCADFVPARGVAYTATKIGTETVYVQGESIAVTVK